MKRTIITLLACIAFSVAMGLYVTGHIVPEETEQVTMPSADVPTMTWESLSGANADKVEDMHEEWHEFHREIINAVIVSMIEKEQRGEEVPPVNVYTIETLIAGTSPKKEEAWKRIGRTQIK